MISRLDIESRLHDLQGHHRRAQIVTPDLNGRRDVPEQARQPVVYEAGEWEVDLGRRELRARRIPVPLGGRAFELLEVLVARRDDPRQRHCCHCANHPG